MTSPALIARIKESVDLVALVASYAEIRQGRILCPWHSEKRPSCRVYADHVFCYTCNQGGDCFSFLQQAESIPFGEALKRLADAAGISLDEQPVTRKQMVYAKSEAACAAWWWARRTARMVAQAQADYMAMED